MAAEKELYRDTLARLYELCDRRFNGKLVLSQQEAAAIIGVSVRTVQRWNIQPPITCEKLAKLCS